MEAAVSQHRIGEVVDSGDKKGPRLVLRLPSAKDEDSVRVYHNRLMSLCGLTFAALSEKMVSVASKGGMQCGRESAAKKKKARTFKARTVETISGVLLPTVYMIPPARRRETPGTMGIQRKRPAVRRAKQSRAARSPQKYYFRVWLV